MERLVVGVRSLYTFPAAALAVTIVLWALGVIGIWVFLAILLTWLWSRWWQYQRAADRRDRMGWR